MTALPRRRGAEQGRNREEGEEVEGGRRDGGDGQRGEFGDARLESC